MTDTEHLKALGVSRDQNKGMYEHQQPSADILETFNAPKSKDTENSGTLVSLVAPEFSSLCVTGDTLIDICDNETLRNDYRGVPIKDLVGTEGYLYSYEPNTDKVVVNKYHSVRKTLTKTPVLKIKLEKLAGNGKGKFTRIPIELTVTSTHPILVRTGHGGKYEWIEARSLKKGMRLISDQRSSKSSEDDTIRGQSRHRLLAEALLKRHLKKEEVVHHIDHNHFNNGPTNIELMGLSEHLSHHQSEKYGYDISLDVNQLTELYAQGKTLPEIAMIYDCDQGTIRDRLKGNVVFRSHSDVLKLKYRLKNESMWYECRDLYEKGYTTYEIGDYFKKHATTITDYIRRAGGEMLQANQKRYQRPDNLPSLNHRVVSIEDAGTEDVYNLEVENTECYFANGVVVHNCPITGQPDFAAITIDYVPDKKCVESKALKLYVFSFRNFGEFHEACVARICDDLVEVLDPLWIRVVGYFTPRGGVVIHPTQVYSVEGYTLPDDLKQRLRNDPKAPFAAL